MCEQPSSDVAATSAYVEWSCRFVNYMDACLFRGRDDIVAINAGCWFGCTPKPTSSVNRDNVIAAPEKAGVHIIYEPAGPFYVGRSSCNIRRRLLAHLNSTGNQNVKLA